MVCFPIVFSFLKKSAFREKVPRRLQGLLGLRASPAHQEITFGLNSQVVSNVSWLGLIPSANILLRNLLQQKGLVIGFDLW